MEKVMVICGGKHQIPLVKKTKELGYVCLCTNLYEDSPCFEYADKSSAINVLDKENNLLFARENNVDGIVTDQSEISVKTAAYVSEQLGIPSISYETACLFTDKYKMRAFCEKEGFDYPKYEICDKKEDAISFWKKLGKKAIIKPTDSFSSRGVFSINSEKDIIDHFDEAITNSPQQKIIIEEYISGTEFTVDAIVTNGKVYNLAISEKEHYSYNENIANSLTFSYDNPQYDYDLLRKTNSDIISASGLRFGLTHCEYKFHNDQFYLIEMAARGGGVYIASGIVPHISGVDNYKIYIESALGHNTCDLMANIDRTIEQNKNKVAKLAFIDIKPNNLIVKDIHGIECIKENKNVFSFECDIIKGQCIPLATSDSTRLGHYIIIADSLSELHDTEKFVQDTFKVEYYDEKR